MCRLKYLSVYGWREKEKEDENNNSDNDEGKEKIDKELKNEAEENLKAISSSLGSLDKRSDKVEKNQRQIIDPTLSEDSGTMSLFLDAAQFNEQFDGSSSYGIFYQYWFLLVYNE